MITKTIQCPSFCEKYYYRDFKLVTENHSFGIFAWYESEYRAGHIYSSDWNCPFYTIYLVTEGIMEEMDFYGNKYQVPSGGIVLHSSFIGYRARAVTSLVRRKCFHLYKTEFTKKLISCFFPEEFIFLAHPDLAEAESLFDRIKEEYCRNNIKQDPSALLGLVTELLEHIRYRLPAHTRNSRFDQILSCVENNLNTPRLNREFLCLECGTSPSTLDRLFRKHVFQSVNEYIVEKRLNHACDLLSVTTLRVSEIASASGFSSINHMNWLFKKKFGMTPTKYREKTRLAYIPVLDIKDAEKTP